MNNILGLSGKKQSGKKTAANVLMANAFNTIYETGMAKVDAQGRLTLWSDDLNDFGIFETQSRNPKIRQFLCENIWPNIKHYSIADFLKSFCINILGIAESQCYDHGNAVTHLQWEDMPGVVNEVAHAITHEDVEAFKITPHEPGYMTANEVLDFFGNDVIRRVYPDALINATLRQIAAEQSAMSVILDVEHVNEVANIKGAGGKIIRFLRDPLDSESPLDKYEDAFDAVIDNSNMTIEEQSIAVGEVLVDWGWFKQE